MEDYTDKLNTQVYYIDSNELKKGTVTVYRKLVDIDPDMNSHEFFVKEYDGWLDLEDIFFTKEDIIKSLDD